MMPMTTITDSRGALVTIGDIDRPHRISSEPNQTLWADRTSLVVVDSLPHVSGRLNTGAPA